MAFHRSDFADLNAFLAIARHRSLRRAGLELGVSASALSHALKGLEARLGVRLLNRTNRSITLTAAGETLQAEIAHPFATIIEATEALNHFRETPAGRIRLNVAEHAAALVLAPVLPVFLERYPDMAVDLCVSNQMVDIVERGFDAGIRYGGTVPEDMIAQRISGSIRWVAVASPDYLARFGVPAHPDDLRSHRCIRSRLGDDRIYHWEFERDDAVCTLDVPGTLTVDSTALAIDLAVRGAGLCYLPEPSVAAPLAAGALAVVLGDWAPVGEPMHLYHSGRRQLPMGLRLLIDTIREMRPLGY
ncbi:LysR family transcriptional regulator [Sphingomonas sp. R1]|uniref:LysR family transcriptional regulator n=1 Tax=Sphingomonas sp. R1 TaxID=399176 RepID=UPI0022247825|nr:LysR family transcriptional regulator [Sphingomonas sp. R1]UYY78491.1 LysR family transcriptional regulator [Sphingomonas sp. R1]